MLKIGLRQNEGAPALGHLDPIYRQKTVGIHGGRLPQLGGVEHGGPEQAVKIDDVFADEVI